MKQTRVLNVDYQLGDKEIVFTVEGEPRFKMPVDVFLGLIDVAHLRQRMAKLKEVDPFYDIRNLGIPEFVRVLRLTKKGLLQEQVAAVTGISPEHARMLNAKAMDQGWSRSANFDFEMQRQGVEGHDRVKCRVKPDPFGGPGPERSVFLEAWTVKRLLDKGKDAAAIAQDLGLDAKDLQLWIAANKDSLAAIPERKDE